MEQVLLGVTSDFKVDKYLNLHLVGGYCPLDEFRLLYLFRENGQTGWSAPDIVTEYGGDAGLWIDDFKNTHVITNNYFCFFPSFSLIYFSKESGNWSEIILFQYGVAEGHPNFVLDIYGRIQLVFVGGYDDEIYFMGNHNQLINYNVPLLITLINHLFKRGPAPDIPGDGDMNCNGTVSPSDIIVLINYLFKQRPHPCCH